MAKYLSAENLEEASACDIGEYPLPYDPEMLVRVKSVSMSRMKQFQESQKKGGAVASAAEKALITESIVGPDGLPLYTAETAERSLKGKTRFVLALIKMINKHNGGNDNLDSEIEDVAKN